MRWRIFWWYAAGAVVAFVAMRAIAFVPNKATVYILLGLMPFAVQVLPANAQPNIEWRYVPFFTGIGTTVIQFMAGVGGLFFDIFFQKSSLDRRTTNATKAAAQTFSHSAGAYFGSLVGFGELEGRGLGAGDRRWRSSARSVRPMSLERMTDHSFRQWTLVIIYTLAVVYLIRGGLAARGRAADGYVSLLRSSCEHLDLALQRDQAGFHAELRLLLVALLAEVGEHGAVQLGLGVARLQCCRRHRQSWRRRSRDG